MAKKKDQTEDVIGPKINGTVEPEPKPKVEEKPQTSNATITIDFYLKLKGLREWEKGGRIAFAKKNAKENAMTTEEWDKLFEKY